MDLERQRMVGTIRLNDCLMIDGDTKQLEQIMSERGLNMDYMEFGTSKIL